MWAKSESTKRFWISLRKLDPLEYETMRKHPQVGAEILQGIRSFEPIVPAVRYHHERWDGQGYPEGLAGERIPLWARIITVADVWDAITDDRPYRLAFAEAEALAFMEQQAGRMFDPPGPHLPGAGPTFPPRFLA